MKNITKILLAAFLSLPVMAFAQEKPRTEQKNSPPVKKGKEKIAFILNNKVVEKELLDALAPEEIKTIKIIKEIFNYKGVEYTAQIRMESHS